MASVCLGRESNPETGPSFGGLPCCAPLGRPLTQASKPSIHQGILARRKRPTISLFSLDLEHAPPSTRPVTWVLGAA